MDVATAWKLRWYSVSMATAGVFLERNIFRVGRRRGRSQPSGVGSLKRLRERHAVVTVLLTCCAANRGELSGFFSLGSLRLVDL